MPATTQSTSLEPWEISIIDSFVRAASLIGLPRSIGEIYGVVYCSAEPINFEQIVERLGISRGSVSQGLKTLRQIGAVRTHYLPGVRIDHYIAELSMERLVRGFLKDQFTPPPRIQPAAPRRHRGSGRRHRRPRHSRPRRHAPQYLKHLADPCPQAPARDAHRPQWRPSLFQRRTARRHHLVCTYR